VTTSGTFFDFVRIISCGRDLTNQVTITQPVAARYRARQKAQRTERETKMTMRKVLPFFLVAGLAVASARSYTVNLFQPSMVGTTELKPGEYKIQVNDQKAVIRKGKVQTESQVKVEESDTKFDTTVVRYVNGADGKVRIQEIRIGGTRTRLLFTM
jgi:hypothetical protein